LRKAHYIWQGSLPQRCGFSLLPFRVLLTMRKITVKSGREISHFSPTGLVFDDGSQVEADLVIFATGYVLRV
jgi:hypothetical protein